MANILIVDDSKSTLSFIQNMLEEAGHVALPCTSAHEAVKQLRDGVDLLITDLYMPDKDGLELILEARKLRANMPIIAISAGEGVMDLRSVASVMGAAVTLQKPFSKQQLLDAVAKTLNAVPAV